MRLFITYRKACRQRDRKVYRQTEILADRQTGRQAGYLVVREQKMEKPTAEREC